MITKHGVPVAMLVPPRRGSLDAKTAVEKLKEFRKGHSLDGLTIREMIEEGRRY
jgi:antitoxin (DNA-binding transcriptional repressor) of toxin-antitoxin stability system